MDCRQSVYEQLIKLAEKQGYLTFENVMNCADEYALPIQDFDWLSNSISTRGILVCDGCSPHSVISEDDEFDDFAQCDYDSVYKKVIELNSSLEIFVSYVRSVRPPQKGEIAQLKYQLIDGNAFARDRLINMYLRFALRIALQRAEAYDMDIVDAVGSACEGLLLAVNKYDPDSSGAFASYASFWVFQRITRYQSSQHSLIHYPYHKRECYYSMYPLMKAHGCIGCDNLRGCADALQMVQEKISCSEKDAKLVIAQMIPDERFEDLPGLNTDVFNEPYSDETSIGALLSKLSTESVFSKEDFCLVVEKNILKADLAGLLSELTPRQERILRLRYGLDGEERTLEEVGAKMGITRERVRQIEADAFRKIRFSPRAQKLRDYL